MFTEQLVVIEEHLFMTRSSVSVDLKAQLIIEDQMNKVW